MPRWKLILGLVIGIAMMIITFFAISDFETLLFVYLSGVAGLFVGYVKYRYEKKRSKKMNESRKTGYNYRSDTF